MLLPFDYVHDYIFVLPFQCNVADLDDMFEISQKTTDKQDILSAGMVQHESIINVKCKLSGQQSWVFCQNKTWIRHDKQCM